MDWCRPEELAPPGFVMVPCGMFHRPPMHRKMLDFPAPLCPVRRMDEPFSSRKLSFSTSLIGGVLTAPQRHAFQIHATE